MGDFFSMGSYGIYVWSSYAIAAVVLLLNYLIPVFKSRQIIRRLTKMHASFQENKS